MPLINLMAAEIVHAKLMQCAIKVKRKDVTTLHCKKKKKKTNSKINAYRGGWNDKVIYEI